MAFLRLLDLRSGDTEEFETSEIRLGRDPDLELVVTGSGAEVVSSEHAALIHDQDRWWIEDRGSRNGTYLNGRRLVAGAREPLPGGAMFRLGRQGPRFRVEALVKRKVAPTVIEGPREVRPSAPTMPMEGLGGDVPPGPPPDRAAATQAAGPPDAPAGGEEPAPSPPPPPPPAEPVRITLMEARSGESFEAAGDRFRIGRGKECELRPVGPGDTSVSRLHAEIVLKPDGTVVLRDAKSRNGTFANGRQLSGEHELHKGDRIQLGEAGPELAVTRLEVHAARREVEVEAEPQPAASATGDAPEDAAESPEAGGEESPAAAAKAARAAAGRDGATRRGVRRSFGGKGATVFFSEMFDQTSRKQAKRLRWILWTFPLVLAAAVAGVYWYTERQREQLLAQQEEALAAQRAVADSIRQVAQADYERLQAALEDARASSAPAAVVESLRTELDAAQERTAALAAALERAQRSLAQQMAAGDSLRQQAQNELDRLREQLRSARNTGTPTALLDSLRDAVAAAQDRAASIETQLRAVRGADLASIAQANQSAVGLVTAFFADGVFDGSGFVITSSGYFVTNRHVVTENGGRPDSVFVTMADRQRMQRSDLVSVASATGPDLAVLKIRAYSGSHVPEIDWTGTRARQGEPAALIGFPKGTALALDRNRAVRTSMSAGIFSKVTAEAIQFDGFTVGGSSGSPIFNANGEVVGVHRAGLRETAGLSFAVPVSNLVPLLPAEAKAELGLN